jgi:hypothetical protein
MTVSFSTTVSMTVSFSTTVSTTVSYYDGLFDDLWL